jgi:hypothetical protein
MYVYMYICIYIYIHIQIYLHMHTFMYLHTCMFMHAYLDSLGVDVLVPAENIALGHILHTTPAHARMQTIITMLIFMAST